MAETGAYRFLLDGTEVHPVFGNDTTYSFEKTETPFYFRKKLSSEVKFYGAQYTYIRDSAIHTKFTLGIDIFDGATWQSDYVGEFYKTDCKFDGDTNIVTVKTEPSDGYEDLKTVLNTEYNLVDLSPVATPVLHTLKPILQVVPILSVFIGKTIIGGINNIVGVSHWIEDIDTNTITPGDLLNQGFVAVANTVPTSNVIAYARYLTVNETFNGIATTDRPENDASAVSSAYDKISSQVQSLITSYFGMSEDPTSYGLAVDCGDGESYFQDANEEEEGLWVPISPDTAWGIEGSECRSFWVQRPATDFSYEELNSSFVSIDNCYGISEALQKLLSQETALLHKNSTLYSSFLYSTLDPIAGLGIDLYITPKSNVVNVFYNEPARKSSLRVSDILNLMSAAYNCSWHIETVDDEKRLRIEHVSWYENGGSYVAPAVTIDLTSSVDSRTGKPQSFSQNKFTYRKDKMPQRYEYGWDNDANTFFNGYPIKVLAEQINKGQTEDLSQPLFTPDIDGLQGKGDVSLDGWVILNAAGRVTKQVHSTYVNVKSSGVFELLIQNGSLSYKNLHPAYHRYGKPASAIEVNGEETTALSITRSKQQEVTFTYSGDIDPLGLITTELGDGQVDTMSLNIISRLYKATINLDTE